MALVQLIPVGIGETSSPEFTVGEGVIVLLVLNDAEGPNVTHGARARIEIKDPSGQFFEISDLVSDASGKSMAIGVQCPGTYRVTRVGTVRCGVFQA